MKQFIYLLSFFIFYSCSGSNSTPEYRTATTALRSDKDPRKAELVALKAIELYPDNPLPAFFLASEIYGQPNSQLKNYDKAATYFKMAIEMDNKDDDDDKLEAPKMIEEGIKLETIKQGVAYFSERLWVDVFNEGISHISAKNNEKASESFLLAASLLPNDSRSYNALATIYFEMENYNEAVTYADKAIKIENTDPNLWSIKGSIASISGDNLLAEELFSKAYDLSIKNNESVNSKTAHMSRLFDILFKNDKKEQALELSEKLIETDPSNIDLYNNAGAVYQNLLIDRQVDNAELFRNLSILNESELEQLKIAYNDCIQLAQKARENFLMCSELELDEVESELYYDESKKIKSIIKDIKRTIKKINKKLDEN